MKNDELSALLDAINQVWKAGNVFTERERSLIANSELYANNNPAGLPGHNLMIVIYKFSTLTQNLIERMNPEQIQKAIDAYQRDTTIKEQPRSAMLKLIDEAERLLLALQQDGLSPGNYPKLERAIEAAKKEAK